MEYVPQNDGFSFLRNFMPQALTSANILLELCIHMVFVEDLQMKKNSNSKCSLEGAVEVFIG